MAGAGDEEDARGAPGRARLSVVATPIGNLEDLSARALATLRACDRIAAEDTRRTRALLTHFGIAGKPMIALHAHSSEDDVARVVTHLEHGEHIALVTDAGTPLVSDPGSEMVRAAIAAGVRIEPIPGASAVTAALCASGLATDAGFRFLGFLPRDGVARGRAIAIVCETPEPVVIFEAPNRTSATLRELAELAVDREWIGEIAIVLGSHDPDARGGLVDDAALDARIDDELGKGLHAKTIAERLAAWSGRPKRDVYERVVARKRGA
jgi:16S rRNA (cytidine1402-2'-O)-methyltransferase